MTRLGFLRWLAFIGLTALAIPLRVFSKPLVQKVADMAPRFVIPDDAIQPITPTSSFYVEDISGVPDSAKNNRSDWALTINGLVAHPLQLNLKQCAARPQIRKIITLSCIGNPVGGYALGNAEWQGLSLSQLIEDTRPSSKAEWLILKGGDGYFESIPLKKAYHPGAMLATHMNGQPLTLDHGFPMRLLVPGLYGIKQVKWIHTIELTDQRKAGYWNEKGWDRDAKVQVFSRIDFPRNEDWLERGDHVIRGIAFAGDRSIEYVQISFDEGAHWNLAQLEAPLSPYSWVFWSYPVSLNKRGRFKITVRAKDQFSGVQQGDKRDPFPSGVNAYHRIEAKVY